MKTVDLAKFDKRDIQMVQMGLSFCIPASAHSIFRYHDSSFSYSQEYLLGLMVVNTTDNQPSFGAMVNHVLPIVKNKFMISNPSPQTFQLWCDNIKKEIDLSNPIAIATRVAPNSVHIRVVLGYDDTAEEFLLYNPGTAFIDNNRVANRIQTGLLYQIKSELEKYSYKQASDDYHYQGNPGPTHDQLVVHLI